MSDKISDENINQPDDSKLLDATKVSPSGKSGFEDGSLEEIKGLVRALFHIDDLPNDVKEIISLIIDKLTSIKAGYEKYYPYKAMVQDAFNQLDDAAAIFSGCQNADDLSCALHNFSVSYVELLLTIHLIDDMKDDFDKEIGG